MRIKGLWGWPDEKIDRCVVGLESVFAGKGKEIEATIESFAVRGAVRSRVIGSQSEHEERSNDNRE